jgi:hypothetical protein
MVQLTVHGVENELVHNPRNNGVVSTDMGGLHENIKHYKYNYT